MARAGAELRRWALVGLGLAGLVFAGSRQVLRDSARVEPFRVEVAAPQAVTASAKGLRWSGRVRPDELAARVEARVDGVVVPVALAAEVLTIELGAARTCR